MPKGIGERKKKAGQLREGSTYVQYMYMYSK
jgi:hypothetical protein